MNKDTTHRVSREPDLHGAAAFRSLLVPIDLTPSSDRILGRVARLPLAKNVQITLLHVVPGSIASRDRRSAEHDANEALANEAYHLGRVLPKYTHVHPLVQFGNAARVIGACATQVKAELIVMGRGGGRVLRDTFPGSTAERVLRQAQRPVLVVRLSARAAYRRPTLALDLDQAAHEIVQIMLRVLPAPRPRVAVVHAYDIPYAGLIYPSLSNADDHNAAKEFRHQAAEKLARLLGTALAHANVPPKDAPAWKAYVRYGPPRLVVETVMRQTATDLLVLGTRSRSGARYAFLGTVAGDLLRRATCDVLVVPPCRSRAR